MSARCAWYGRFGAELTDYRLHPTTPRFVRPLCPACSGGIADKQPVARAEFPSHGESEWR